MECTRNYCSSLHKVLRRGDCDLQTIKEHLSINFRDDYGDTPLTAALRNDNCSLEVLKFLLAHGADVNIQNIYSPIHLAILNPNLGVDAVKELIKHGADVNALIMPLHFGIRPLHFAVGRCCKSSIGCDNQVTAGEIENYRIFQDMDMIRGTNAPEFSFVDNSINSLAQNIEIIQELVNCGADVNAANGKGNTVLHEVATYSSTYISQTMKCLVSLGADINAKNNNNSTPLHLLLENKDCVLGFVEEFIKSGAFITERIFMDSYFDPDGPVGKTLLHIAVQNRWCKLDVLKFLLSLGIQPNAKNENGSTVLHLAVQYEHSNEVLQLLCASGADINSRDIQKHTPLHYAIKCKLEAVRISKKLISLGADVNAKASLSVTPLHLSVRDCNTIKESNYDLVNLLLMNGAGLRVYNNLKSCPVRYVCCNYKLKYRTKYMLLMLKYAILHYSYNPKNYNLFFEYRSYKEEFRHEMKLMEDLIINEDFTLWDVAINNPKMMEVINIEYNLSTSLPLSLLIQLPQKFEIYHDVIVYHLPKKYFALKVVELVFSVDHQPMKELATNLDCVIKLAGFLTNKDLFNFLLAFSLPFCNKKRYQGSNSVLNSKKMKTSNLQFKLEDFEPRWEDVDSD